MTATDTTEQLGSFEGDDVLGTAIIIRKAGDGLSNAVKTEPKLLRKGQTVYVVLECEVGQIRFDPVKHGDGVTRVQIMTAGTATFMEGDFVREAIDVQREKNERAAEAAEGVQRLPTDDELDKQHFLGEHAKELVEGCPSCQDEIDAKAAEG